VRWRVLRRERQPQLGQGSSLARGAAGPHRRPLVTTATLGAPTGAVAHACVARVTVAWSYRQPAGGRRKPDASHADWQEAELLLRDAASVQVAAEARHGAGAPIARPHAAANASGAAAARDGGGGGAGGDGGGAGGRAGGPPDDPLDWEYPGVEVAADGHLGALMELASAVERGAPGCMCL